MLTQSCFVTFSKSVFKACCLALVCTSGVGCAAVMASKQPEKKDLSVLHPGAPRNHVMAELGVPTQSTKSAEGTTTDLYDIKQGYSGITRYSRTALHVVGDISTGFLWELAGLPIETAFSGESVRAEVIYDPSDRAQRIEFYRGAYLHQGGPTLPSWMKREAKETALIGDPSFGRDSGVRHASATTRSAQE